MGNRILITGASGSGSTTLGRVLALHLSAGFFDSDDYYWLPSRPPFQAKEAPASRLTRILEDLSKHPAAVLAGSVMQWGADLEDSFSLVVFLTVPADLRVKRLRDREVQRFGRADPQFLKWAAQYDSGELEGRSLSKHKEWLSRRRCTVLHIDGDVSTTDRLARVVHALDVQHM
jgi:uridine kinase